MTITRAGHAHEGRVLRVVGRRQRPEGLELRVELPDGSRLHLPAAWADVSGGMAGCADAVIAADVGQLIHFLHLRRLVDSLLDRRESACGKEKPHAIAPRVSGGKGRETNEAVTPLGADSRIGPSGGGKAACSSDRPDVGGGPSRGDKR